MRRPLRNLLLLAAASAVALCTASTASAANVIPNPSFEEVCGAPTDACYWNEVDAFGFQIHRDTSDANTGSASYRFAYAGESLTVGVGAPCVTETLAAGSATAGFSYRTSSPVTTVRLEVGLYSSPDCAAGSFLQFVQVAATAITDDAWHDVTATQTIPPTQSFTVSLGFSCNSFCGGDPPDVVFYDDIVFDAEQPPTAVRLSSLQGQRRQTGVLLSWRTASEANIVGFNLYRLQKGKLVKVNRALIPSVFGGTASGHRYSWLDRNAPRSGNVRYRLQALSLSGKHSWIGGAVASR